MTVVPTSSVKIAKGFAPTQREIERVKHWLLKQGLIEPLKLDHRGEIGRMDCYDPARLEAAKQLNWPTVIMAFYEESSR